MSRINLPVIKQWYDRAGDLAADAAKSQGFPCAPSCSWCCTGPVAVTDVDLRVVEHGIRLMAPDERQALELRAQRYRDAIQRAGMDTSKASPTLRALRENPAQVLPMLAAAWPELACPALVFEPKSAMPGLEETTGHEHGLCALYDHRPLTCRTHHAMGPIRCKPHTSESPAMLDARNVHAKARESFKARFAGILGLEIARIADESRAVGVSDEQ